jgi:hypothetical protein
MKRLLAIVILAALAWSGYWVFMAETRERLLEGWLAERRAEGWVADVTDLHVSGFPNRIDTFMTGLALADPDEGWRWNAEGFQILSMSWKPHHLIAVWPGEQVIGSPYETIRMTGETLRGSVIFRPTPRLELDRTSIEIGGLRLAGDLGWEARIDAATLATRQVPDAGEHAHQIAFNATGLVPPNAWSERIPGSRALPREMETLKLDVVVDFDRPWDRAAVETKNPAITAIELHDATAVWGDLSLRAQGRLETDAQGFAEGEITLRARNWRQMLSIAEQSEAISSDLAGAMRGGLDLIAMLSGDRDTIEVPLDFRDGRTYLGPIPVGAAPRLSRK